MPSRTRGGVGRDEKPEQDASDVLLAECAEVPRLMGAMIAEVRYQASEHGYGGYHFDDMFDRFTGSGSLRWGKSQEAMDDFNSNLFSFLCSFEEQGVRTDDDVALTMNESESTEIRMPSGSVSEAEVPPVSVAGVHKSAYRDAWVDAMDRELQGLKDSKTFTVVDDIPRGRRQLVHAGFSHISRTRTVRL